MKFKFYSQLESNDCGPACLAMVASHYGYNATLKNIKDLCSVTRMGVSVKDILDGGRKLGFECGGIKIQISQLKEIPLPAILFWKQDHFVVLYKIKERKGQVSYHLADPGYGTVVVDNDLLEKEWCGNSLKGVALVFQATGENLPIPNSRKKTEPYFKHGQFVKGVYSFIKSKKSTYSFSLILLVLGLAANWLIPIIFQQVVDRGIIGKSINIVVTLLLAQFCLFIGNFSSGFFSDLILTKLNFNLSVLLKESFFKKLIKLPIQYFDTRLNSDTLQRLTDLSKVQSFLTWKGISFLINSLNLLIFSIILLYLNTLIFSVFFVLSALSVVWVGYFLKRRATLEYSMFIKQSENSNLLYEFIMNMPEIKVNRAEPSFINKISSVQKKLNLLELKSLYLNSYQLSGANFILKLKELITIAICAYLIIYNQMTIGTLLSISYIIGQLSGPIITLINNIHDVQDANISNLRVEDVYGVKNEVEENVKLTDIAKVNIENISIANVSFKYPGSFSPFVLKDISFEILKNKTTAIVGTSGSGKTTLLKLLLLYYHPTQGSININDDLSFSMVDPNEWRKNCGIVLQDGHIFSGTIAYNIALCDTEQIDEEKMIEAAKVACIDDFISELPMSYNTKVGNIGIQLSGGQTQRLLIARAVYKNSDFVFFDEATSSLDANNERAIMSNLSAFFKDKTVIVVAHRLSTVKNADQIIVLEDGYVTEIGTHHNLVTQKNKYYSLVKNQLELGN